VASVALTLMSLFAAAAEEERPSAAEEGKKVITAMLIVGLIFLGVILIGQAARSAPPARVLTSR
jgi:hypothetical protein